MTDERPIGERLIRLETQFEHVSKTLDMMREDAAKTRQILEEIKESGWKSMALLTGISAVIGGIITKLGTWLITAPVK